MPASSSTCDFFGEILGCHTDAISWWQMTARGAVVFVFGLVFIRLLGRRAFGKQSALDIVLAFIVGSNLSRAMTGSAPLMETLAATSVLVALYWVTNRAAARWHRFGLLVKGRPVIIVHDGRADEAGMRKVGVSDGDLEEATRQNGVPDPAMVQTAVLERSGNISIIVSKD